MGNVSAMFDITLAIVCTMSRAIACASARVSPFTLRPSDGPARAGRTGADSCDVVGRDCCVEVDACGCPREGEWERDIVLSGGWKLGVECKEEEEELCDYYR